MKWLRKKLARIVEHWMFDYAVGLVIFVNPIAMFPQLVAAINTTEIKGGSIGMWLIFVAIQTALGLNAVKNGEKLIFASMVLSVAESATIGTLVYMKS